jgi:hypothetical protein
MMMSKMRNRSAQGMKRGRKLAIFAAVMTGVCLHAASVRADPTVTNVTITYVRIYSSGATSAAMLNIAGVPPTFCNGATNYAIALSDAGGEGMLAAALTAVATGNLVSIEVSNATGCTVEFNWGPQVQSLYLISH